MHPVIAEILNWKRGAPVKPVDQKRWQDALRDIDADLERSQLMSKTLTIQVTPVTTTTPEPL